MQIIQNGSEVQILSLVKDYKKKLKSSRVVHVQSYDTLEAIAAYFAWKDVGGNLFFKSPMLPKEVSDALDKKLKNYQGEDTLIYHTSGTTGIPKLIIHNEGTFAANRRLLIASGSWNKHTKFLNLVPPWVASFGHYVINGLWEYDCDLIVSGRDTFLQDVPLGNHAFTVPMFWHQLHSRGVQLDLSNYKEIWIGGDMLFHETAEYIFDNNAQIIRQGYASADCGCPLLLGDKISKIEDFTTDLNFKPLTDDIEMKLTDGGELLIKGNTLCINYKDIAHDGDWYKTRDVWKLKDNNKISFQGRSQGFFKLNGHKYNQEVVEHLIESNTNLGEVAIVLKDIGGNQYTEAYYTNDIEANRHEIDKILSNKLEASVLPKRYHHITEMPRNHYGKKMRHLLAK